MSIQELDNTKQAALQFNAECTSCGASIEFDPTAGQLKCPYCGHETEIPSPENEEELVAQEMDFAKAEQTGNFDWEAERLLKRNVRIVREADIFR